MQQQDLSVYALNPMWHKDISKQLSDTKRHITAYYSALKWTYYVLILRIHSHSLS